MFAVIESGGKQHTVSEGDQLKVELLPGEEGAAIEFDKVLMISDGSASKLGNPFVENAKVMAKLISHGKEKKIKIFMILSTFLITLLASVLSLHRKIW